MASLLDLPNELLLEIIATLLKSDLARIARICKRFYSLSVSGIYKCIPLGYYATAPASVGSPIPTLRVLKALRTPKLVKHVRFIDHVDCPIPKLSRLTIERPPFIQIAMVPVEPLPLQLPVGHPAPQVAPAATGASDTNAPTLPIFDGNDPDQEDLDVNALAVYPPARPPPLNCGPHFLLDRLNVALSIAFQNINEYAPVRTIRIVSGERPSKTVIDSLLLYALEHNCVNKLWIEGVPLSLLRDFCSDRPDLQRGVPILGLTHIRLRKLKEFNSRPPSDIPQVIKTLICCSPNLTSLAFDAVPTLSKLPQLLSTLTLPSLTSFQLRSQTEANCYAPYYLTNPIILEFLLRHPKIKAFAWPAERFLASVKDQDTLLPLVEQFSRQLIWLRADCGLLTFASFDRSRYSGPLSVSRRYLAIFLRSMDRLETIKLQGDYLNTELVVILSGIQESKSSQIIHKFSLIRSGVSVAVLREIPPAMPNLRTLKVCAYYSPGLVSLYEIAPKGVMLEGVSWWRNIPLKTYLRLLLPLKHLSSLTIPIDSGLDISPRVIADIWDNYREIHPPSAKYREAPHYKPFSTDIELDCTNSSTTILQFQPPESNGIILQHATNDPDSKAISPPEVVRRLMRSLREAGRSSGEGLRNLRTLKCFCVLRLQEPGPTLDMYEFLIDVKWRDFEVKDQRKMNILTSALPYSPVGSPPMSSSLHSGYDRFPTSPVLDGDLPNDDWGNVENLVENDFVDGITDDGDENWEDEGEDETAEEDEGEDEGDSDDPEADGWDVGGEVDGPIAHHGLESDRVEGDGVEIEIGENVFEDEYPSDIDMGEKRAVVGQLEIIGKPVLVYGWGTELWFGRPKDISSRAWF